MKRWGRNSEDGLERELRDTRPTPNAGFESRMLDQLAARDAPARRAPRRVRALVVALVLAVTVVLAALGGMGQAASSTVEVASNTVATVGGQTTAVVKVVKRAVKPAKNDKPKVVTASPASDQYHPDRVTICHQTGAGSVTITVARSALPAHLAHGDAIGPCGG